MTDQEEGAARHPNGAVQIVRDSSAEDAYLVTRDEFGDTSARLYVNDRGTPMKRARQKRVASVFEVAADNLSAAYTADDDPNDWGRSMGITIAEFSVASNGSLEREVIVETDANAALAPYPTEAFAGFGRGVNELLSAWGVL
jgi:hypothetical protein